MNLNLFNYRLKSDTPSYIENVLAERPNDLVASFMSDFLEIPLIEAKAIHNLDDFDKYIYEIHKNIAGNPELFVFQSKVTFLWKYYGATLGYQDHFRRFQEMTDYMLHNKL